MRVAFATLGCKVNQYETEVLKSLFASDGFDVVGFEEEADVYVLNSCTVTESGDKKTRQLLRQAKRRNPSAVLAITGCFPQAFPEKAELLTEVSVVQGAYNRHGLLGLVKEHLRTGERLIRITPHEKDESFEPMKVVSFAEHTRAFVKIEDGCDRYCSYCIIPKARGPIRSKTPQDLKSELEALAENGYREVVLVGINLSSYGKETGYSFRLPDAVEAAGSVDGIKRIRLGSLEPELLTDEDLNRMAAEEKFCPQFHLALQSGCDATLKRMNRHYTAAEYKEIAERIRSVFKNAAITTDIMVGFPGEDEEEFTASMEFAREIGFARMHVFAYSPRKSTRAAEMENQVAAKVKAERSKRMLKTASKLQKKALLQECERNEVSSVLFETKLSDGRYTGYTQNYTKVIVESQEDICEKILDVKLLSAEDEHCIGVLL